MIHTVKTTCAISALLVSFAATAHAANVVSDPYASYVDCSYAQQKTSGNSGCTVRGQQVTVSALSQMMAVANANAYNYTAIGNYSNLRLKGGGEEGYVQYERGTERGVDGKDREVKQLVFLIKDPKDKGDSTGRNGDEAGRNVRENDIRDANGRLIKDGRTRQPVDRQPVASAVDTATTRVYKIDLSDDAAAQIEKAVPRKRERDAGDSSSSSTGSRVATANDDDSNGGDNDRRGRMEVVMPLVYASPAEIKAEEERVKAKAASAAKSATETSTVTLVKPETADQSSENLNFKVTVVNFEESTNGMTLSIITYGDATAEVIYTTTVRADTMVAYRVREVAPVTRDLAQGGMSATPGENIRDQSYTGINNTPVDSGNQPEPMDKDNPESGKGGSGTLR